MKKLPPITWDDQMTAICTLYGIRPEQVMQRTRKEPIAEARHAIMYYLKLRGYGPKRIGQYFIMNHSTVCNGIKTMMAYLYTYPNKSPYPSLDHLYSKIKTQNKVKNAYKKAESRLQEFAQLKRQKAEKDAQMKEIALELQEFAEENRQLFEDDKLEFPDLGALRFASKTTVSKLKKFDPKAFFQDFAPFCSLSTPVAAIKKAFEDPDTAKAMKAHGISLKTEEDFKIEV